jgi:hypothetical protein
VLATTSRRTPAAAADALALSLTAPTFLHAWGAAGPNPYGAMLALADAFVVTSDSISMIADAVATGRPTYLAPVPYRRRWHHGPVGTDLGALGTGGVVQAPRDLARVHGAALAAGLVLPWPPAGPLPAEGPGRGIMAREAEAAVARVRALMEEPA